ncbi:MAG: transposase [Christensenellaceae bacterium]|nr:transposase [Christensenellaceae bacterium]
MEFMTRLEIERQKVKVFLFLDNLKVHHGKIVKEWLEEHQDHIQVFYFP